jgi:hypothetical protein
MKAQERNRRIEMIRANLAENDRLYNSGKRPKSLWNVCKRDGKRAIAELQALKSN